MLLSTGSSKWILPLLGSHLALAQACGSNTFKGNTAEPARQTGSSRRPGAKSDAVARAGTDAGTDARARAGTDAGTDARAGAGAGAGAANVKDGDADKADAPKDVLSASGPAPVTGDLCAGRTSTLRVFILDLKSGWFAGDGGDTFKDFVADTCGSKVDIVYAHVTRTVIEGNISEKPDAKNILACDTNDPSFLRLVQGVGLVPNIEGKCALGDLSSFQQVWVLGGSEADEEDIPLQSPFFLSIATRLSERASAAQPAGFFFGAGLGNTQHANALLAAVSPALAGGFAPNRERGEAGIFPEPETMRTAVEPAPLKAAMTPSIGTFDAKHPLFVGLETLVDYKPHSSSGNTCSGDMITALVGVPGAAVDACGQVTVAAGEYKPGARIVLEANMARFYRTTPAEWFNRIVNWLAPVSDVAK